MIGLHLFPHATSWPTGEVSRGWGRLQDRALYGNQSKSQISPDTGRGGCRPSSFRQTSTSPRYEPHVPLVVVDVLPTMRRPSHDVASDPDPLLPSLQQTMITEPLPATRLPRSPQPPSLPLRNPLRPRPTSDRNDSNDCPASPVMSPLRMQIVHTQSLPLLATVKTITVNSNETNGTINVDEKPSEKALPDSPTMVPLSPVDIDDGDSSTGSSSILNNPAPSPPTMSKRNHALLELLSSERAYASDLALIRDIHIPVALGE